MGRVGQPMTKDEETLIQRSLGLRQAELDSWGVEKGPLKTKREQAREDWRQAVEKVLKGAPP